MGPDVTFGTKWCGIAIAWNAGITARAAVASSWYEQMRGINGQREISAWDSACGGRIAAQVELYPYVPEAPDRGDLGLVLECNKTADG